LPAAGVALSTQLTRKLWRFLVPSSGQVLARERDSGATAGGGVRGPIWLRLVSTGVAADAVQGFV
jgi:hypothetical protein